jgi:hypothetical protein
MSITFTPAIWDGGIVDMTAAANGDSPAVNVHNGNARALFDLLGIEPNQWDGGETTAEDFLGRVLIARALLDLQVDDEHGLPATQDGRFTWGGRRPGALAGRLAELQELAEWALANDRIVGWG